MSRPYCLHLGWERPVEVTARQFERLRRMPRLFAWKENKPKKLRLRTEKYFAYRENGEFRFHEKESRRVVFAFRVEDSIAKVERLCAAHDPRYIRDDAERQRQIQIDYA